MVTISCINVGSQYGFVILFNGCFLIVNVIKGLIDILHNSL